MKPYLLHENNWGNIKDQDFDLVVLPWGATEAHNYHMPYGTDNYQVEHVAELAAKEAWEKGAKVLVLPAVPFGVNTGQLDVKLCMNMRPETQLMLLNDLVDVVQRAGIKKFLILNGHGGNSFKTMIRELSFTFPDVFVAAANWYRATDLEAIFEEPGDHAGEAETSCIMYLRSELVRPLSEAGDGFAKKWKFKAFKEGWATSQRPWTKVTKDTGVGDPKASTAEKGKRYFKETAANIAELMLSIAKSEHWDFFED